MSQRYPKINCLLDRQMTKVMGEALCAFAEALFGRVFWIGEGFPPLRCDLELHCVEHRAPSPAICRLTNVAIARYNLTNATEQHKGGADGMAARRADPRGSVLGPDRPCTD